MDFVLGKSNAFSAVILSVGHQKRHLACKKLCDEVLVNQSVQFYFKYSQTAVSCTEI